MDRTDSDKPKKMKTILSNSATELFDFLNPQAESTPEKNPCPKCGLSLKGYIQTGLFGCPYCYIHYREEVFNISNHIQEGGLRHTGKRPRNAAAEKTAIQEKLKILKLRLAKAKELEKFEEAASLAKEIEEINKKF